MLKNRIAVISLLIVVFSGLMSCVSVKPIDFKGVNSLKIGESASSSGMVVTTNLSLYNPNSFEFHVNNGDIDVYVENVNLGKLKIPNSFHIPSKSDFTGDFYLEISYTKLLLSGKNVLSKIKSGKVQMQLKGTIDAQVLWIDRVFIVDYNEYIDLR